jgi:hypothetical protein
MEPLICRSHSSSVPSHEIIGAYTPVTKRLWVERLNWASKLKEATLAPATIPKPPNPITITYPFSSDNALAEMVGCGAWAAGWGFGRGAGLAACRRVIVVIGWHLISRNPRPLRLRSTATRGAASGWGGCWRT